jgi:outer membrane protein OmpA-like peptidoglycan-associated protein
MNQVAKIMSRNPEIHIEISVHTDNTGTNTANLNLSERRAQLLVDYLVSTGMSRERLTARGYGSSRPVANNLTEEGRRLNRRVDVRIVH